MVQKQNKNIKIVRSFKRKVKDEISVEKIVFFGSRARSDFTENSDFDLMIVSKDFRGIPWYKRAQKLYLIWEQDLPLELLCYTPEEIDKKKKHVGIVAEALSSGIDI